MRIGRLRIDQKVLCHSYVTKGSLEDDCNSERADQEWESRVEK